MKRIVQVVTQMEGGGAQRVALWLAEGLEQRDYFADVWFLYTKRLINTNSDSVRSFLPTPPRPTDYILIIYRVFKELFKLKPEVVITHTRYANVIVQPMAWLLGIQHRIAVQHSPVNNYPYIARLLDKIWGSLGAYTHNVLVSHAVENSVSSYPQNYLRFLKVIPNGLPTSAHSGVDREVLRSRWQIPSKASVLLNVGRLAKVKNQSFLVELIKTLPDVYLIIAGDGELKSELQNRIKELGLTDRVTLTGEIDHKKVQELMSLADAFLFPSQYEAMPLALIEAMQHGLPCVTSAIPATEEVMGEAGLRLPLDKEMWVAAIRKVLNSKDVRMQLGNAAREKGQAFSLEKMVDSYESLWL